MTEKLNEVLYTSEATSTGGRDGTVKSSDGVIDVDLKVPKEMGGPGGAATNPEQLFAAGYAACFEGAMRYVASQKKIAIPADTSVTAHVGIGPREGSGFAIQAKLEVNLPGVDDATAQEIVKTAHEDVCPYSHATRGNIDVDISVNGKKVA